MTKLDVIVYTITFIYLIGWFGIYTYAFKHRDEPFWDEFIHWPLSFRWWE